MLPSEGQPAFFSADIVAMGALAAELVGQQSPTRLLLQPQASPREPQGYWPGQ